MSRLEKQKVEKRDRENLSIQVMATRKETEKVERQLERLEKDIEEKQPKTTPEVINVVHGIHRDMLMALDNLKRINRILFGKGVHTDDEKRSKLQRR